MDRCQQKPRGYWTLDKCRDDALRFKTRAEWQRVSRSCYQRAYVNNWLEECCSHMEYDKQPSGYWTLDKCREDALRFNTRAEWRNNSTGYNVAQQHGWSDECCKHMTQPMRQAYWTLDKCKEDASVYRTKGEWRASSASGYVIAKRNKWLEECCEHMDRAGGPSKPELELLEIIKEKYPNAASKRFNNKSPKFIQRSFELDIFVSELNKGIEFNGTYWHSTKGLKRGRPHWPEDKIERYHEIKEEFFGANGIEILFIKQEDWTKGKAEQVNRCLKFLAEGCR